MNDKETKEIVVKESSLPVVASPAAMMQLAMDKGLDLEKVEKMIELQAKWDAMEAKKAYAQAMAKLKLNPPKILKDKNVHFETSKGPTDYNHSTIGNVEESVTPWLASGGFYVSWKSGQNSENNKIRITCTITHKKGHSESNWKEFEPDVSGGKNGIQGIGSTSTYLQRYTLLELTGLATHDQDDDGKGAGDGLVYITEGQKNTICDLLTATSSDEKKFLKWVGVDSIDEIPEGQYKRIVVNLESKDGGK